MAAAFDPYHKWLGIPPSEQPPTHYRLLALNPFESDPDVIEAAADARMAHLRSLAAGQHASLTQKLLNQISAAKLCLLKPQKRAEYDASLWAQFTAQPAPAAAPAPQPAGALDFIDEQPAALIDSASDPLGLHAPSSGGSYAARAHVRRRKKSAGPLVFMVVAPILGIAAVAAAIIIHNNSQEPSQSDDGSQKNVTTTTPGNNTPDDSHSKTPGSPGQRPGEGDTAKTTPTPPVPPMPYLDDLPEQSVSVGFGILGKHGDTGYPKADMPSRVRLGSFEPHHALAMFPPNHGVAAVSYALDGKYKAFVALAAIIDDPSGPPPISPVQFRVLGDGHLLWSTRSPLQGKGQAQKCSISIEGVKTLSLEVVCVGGSNHGCRAAWIDPQVSIQPPKSVTPGGSTPSGSDVAIDNSHGGRPIKPIPRDPNDTSSSGTDTPSTPATPNPSDTKTPDSQPSTTGDERGPVPDAVAQQKALAQVKELLKDDYAKATTADGVLALARTLGKLATEETSDKVARYVLATQGLDYAIKGGDVQLASAFVGGLNTHYQIDAWELKSKTLSQLSHTVKTSQAKAEIARESLELAEQALSDDRYDAALELALAASTIAGVLHDQPLQDQVKDLRARASKQKIVSDEAKTARAKLATAPDDPDANLIVGRYLCLRKNNWPEGLPLLAKASDAAWKEIGKQETAAPQDAGDQVKLADLWWDAAAKRGEKKDDPWQKPMQARAIYWYRTAMPNLSGLTLTKVKTRIGSDDSLPAQFNDPAVTSVYLDDLNEAGSQIGYGSLGKHGATGYDENSGEPRRVRLNGSSPDHSLAMHPPLAGMSQVTYKLEGKFRTFTATVGIMDGRDRRNPAAAVAFRVVGDGKPLWTSRPFQRQGESIDCKVSVQGVRTLILEVNCAGINNAARAVWIDPQVTK